MGRGQGKVKATKGQCNCFWEHGEPPGELASCSEARELFLHLGKGRGWALV